jgi:predicted GH43/DUF377 family glycosyl hydrolase
MSLLARAAEIRREQGTGALVVRSSRFLRDRVSEMLFPSGPVVKRIGHATSDDLRTWERDPANPVFTPRDPPAWDSQAVEDPTVLVRDGSAHMLYAATAQRDPKSNSLGHAASPDGRTWTRNPDAPVLEPRNSGSWEGRSVQNPGATVVDGTIHLVYGGSGQDESWQGVGHATSADLIRWSDRRADPILTPGPEDAWDSTYLADPCLVYEDDVAHLFYAGFDGSHWQVGHATSTDFETWEKDPTNPVVGYDHRSEWGYLHVGDPTVLRDGDDYHMVHVANTGERKRLLQARSEDLRTWESLEQPVLDPEPDGWEDRRITNPTLFTLGDTYHLLYTGVEGDF